MTLRVLPQLTLQKNENEKSMFEIAIRFPGRGSPISYRPADSQTQQACVRFAQRLIEVVVGALALGLRINKSTREVLREKWRGNWWSCNPNLEKSPHSVIDGGAPYFVECRLQTPVGQGPRKDTPTNAFVISCAGYARGNFLQ